MKVYKAINAVQAELAKAGISKDSTNTFDNYKFRGIDAVYNAVSPLLAKHGLCILPRMLSRTCEERQSQKGGALFYVTVDAEFDFVAAEDGSKHTVKTYGEAMDRGDKATNKAMSAAYKYAAFQTFAIPTEGDNDADASTHEIAAKPKGVMGAVLRNEGALSPERQAFVQTFAQELEEEQLAGRTREWLCAQVEKAGLDDTEKMHLWSMLPSYVRTAMKPEQARPHVEKAALMPGLKKTGTRVTTEEAR